MPGIQRGSDRRAQIDVAQAHHQIGCLEKRLFYLIDAVQPVNTADEFQVARAPGGVLAHRLHVFRDGGLAGLVIPGQGQVHDACGHIPLGLLFQFLFSADQQIQQRALV